MKSRSRLIVTAAVMGLFAGLVVSNPENAAKQSAPHQM